MSDTVKTEVVCGVCGRLHPVVLRTGTFKCPTKGASYDLVVGTVRSLRQTGNKREGTREYNLRARHDDGERLYTWAGKYGDGVEAKSGDQFVLAFHEGRVEAFHNLTIGRYHLFRSTAWVLPATLIGIAVVALLVIAVMTLKNDGNTLGSEPTWCGNPSHSPAGLATEHWDTHSCLTAAEAGGDRWRSCVRWGDYAKRKSDGCGGAELCCPTDLPPQSVCGTDFVTPPAGVSAAQWRTYECQTRKLAGRKRWSTCLRSDKYGHRRRGGCPGASRCCPPQAAEAGD